MEATSIAAVLATGTEATLATAMAATIAATLVPLWAEAPPRAAIALSLRTARARAELRGLFSPEWR